MAKKRSFPFEVGDDAYDALWPASTAAVAAPVGTAARPLLAPQRQAPPPPANAASSSQWDQSNDGWCNWHNWDSGAGGWSRSWGIMGDHEGWVWTQNDWTKADNSGATWQGSRYNSDAQGGSAASSSRSNLKYSCSVHPGGRMSTGSQIKLPKKGANSDQLYGCRSDKPCSECPLDQTYSKDPAIQPFGDFLRNVFHVSTTGKLNGNIYTSTYASVRDKFPFEGHECKGRLPPPMKFVEHSMQPLLMWPVQGSDNLSAQFWPQNGRITTASFRSKYEDHFGCIFYNIWVYEVS